MKGLCMDNNDPISTINSVIYRDIAETLNKTYFDVYIRESYQPVVHGYYLDHPEITPVNAPADFEMDNWCSARYPLTYIVNMLVNGHEFAWKYPSDSAKAEAFLKAYIDQFEGTNLSRDPEQKAFLSNVKTAYHAFHDHYMERKQRLDPPKPKKLSIADRIAMLGL